MSKNEGHLVLDIDCNIGPNTVIVVGRLEMEAMVSIHNRQDADVTHRLIFIAIRPCTTPAVKSAFKLEQ